MKRQIKKTGEKNVNTSSELRLEMQIYFFFISEKYQKTNSKNSLKKIWKKKELKTSS